MSENARIIANYPIKQGLKARIIVYGTPLLTRDAVQKLIDLLKLNFDDLEENDERGRRI
jgi:hypothetical protein